MSDASKKAIEETVSAIREGTGSYGIDDDVLEKLKYKFKGDYEREIDRADPPPRDWRSDRDYVLPVATAAGHFAAMLKRVAATDAMRPVEGPVKMVHLDLAIYAMGKAMCPADAPGKYCMNYRVDGDSSRADRLQAALKEAAKE